MELDASHLMRIIVTNVIGNYSEEKHTLSTAMLKPCCYWCAVEVYAVFIEQIYHL